MSGYQHMSPSTQALYDLVEGPQADESRLLAIIKEGADVNWRDPKQDGATPLHIACIHNNITAARVLLDNKADITAVMTPNLNTPLHIASHHGWTKLAQMLVERGKNVKVQGVDQHPFNILEAKNQYHNTPLHSAAMAGKSDTVQLLLDHGANVNARNARGSTPLHFAQYSDTENPEITIALLAKGALIDEPDKDGITPLAVACTKGHLEVAKVLIKNGANLHYADQLGRKPVDHASERGHQELVEVIKKMGA